MASPEPLPVIRVEQFDGSHEHPEVRRLRAENERLRAVVIRAKDALLDGQSTQWVHDLLVGALTSANEQAGPAKL